MNENAEYDLLLRSLFERCDQTGSGYLSLTEFEDLCSELCLEDSFSLLRSALYTSSLKQLSYERFKKGLLLLLGGNLTEEGLDDDNKISANENHLSLHHSRNDSIDCSVSEEEICWNEDVNDNNQGLKSYSRSSRDNSLGQEDKNQTDWMLIGLSNSNDSSNIDEIESMYSSKELTPFHRGKKYGRKSSPDDDLLKKTSGYNVENNKPFQDSNKHQYHDEIEHESSILSSRLIETEEYIGEGDGSNQWINRDLSLSLSDDVTMSNDGDFTYATEARDNLRITWREIIGDLNQLINVNQLQELYSALSLTSSSSEVEQFFSILDSDGDGLVCFGDFARLMSIFGDEDDDTEKQEEDKKLHLMSSDLSMDFDNKKQPTNINSPTNESYLSAEFSSSETINDFNPPLSSSRSVALFPSDKSNTLANSQTDVSSQSLDAGLDSSLGLNDVHDDMANYHGVPSYRRRRRANQRSMTRHHQRRRCNKAAPHYHPISKQNLEECILYFLTDENGRYVDIEVLRTIWLEYEIEDIDDVLKILGVDYDDSLSVEALFEVFEREVKENAFYHAVCAIYKKGIEYYRSLRDHELAEKNRLEAKLSHIDNHIHEQEEGIESIEERHRNKLNHIENQYKNEVSRLKEELTIERTQKIKRSEEEVAALQKRIGELIEIESKLRGELSDHEQNINFLQVENKELEDRICKSELSMAALQSDFDVLCRQVVQCNRSQTEQQKKMQMLVEEYKCSAQEVQDHNDELFEQLSRMQKRWNAQNQNKPTKFPREDIGMLQPLLPSSTQTPEQKLLFHEDLEPPDNPTSQSFPNITTSNDKQRTQTNLLSSAKSFW